ncbi:unnamed protein product [Allacma fusca]|uniref:Serpin domain-containing protein n=1 Tax=Allacma fusca TaxID=39272 RepID=A0A8J2JWZ1_9HEXA|nr:unnamed protein product [Allacma fusca]
MVKIILVLGLIAFASSNILERREMSTRFLNIISQSTSFFASDLYQQLRNRDDDNGNLVLSPLSLSLLLSSLNVGSRGLTSREITSALRLTGLNEDDILQGYSELIKTLNGESGFTLRSANAIYVDSGFRIKPSFTDVMKTYFQSEPRRIQFSDTSAAAAKINQWVARETNNKIKELVTQKDLRQDTVMILLNAIYFNAEWEKPFDSQRTERKYFTTLQNRSVPAEFMHHDGELRFGIVKQLEAEAVAIPYKDSRAHFVVLLPKNPADFNSFEEKLRGYDLTSIMPTLDLAPIALELPKISLKSKIDFLNEDVLKRLGIKSFYQDGSIPDFTGITDEYRNLILSGVLQRACIDVTEHGTEASAASTAGIVNKIIHRPFTVNRPFVGFIHDSNTNSILFMVRKVA